VATCAHMPMPHGLEACSHDPTTRGPSPLYAVQREGDEETYALKRLREPNRKGPFAREIVAMEHRMIPAVLCDTFAASVRGAWLASHCVHGQDPCVAWTDWMRASGDSLKVDDVTARSEGRS
jgi:hypothetical protein